MANEHNTAAESSRSGDIGVRGRGWEILFKLVLATYPFVIGAAVFVFSTLRDHENKITKLEATTLSTDYRLQLIGDIGILKNQMANTERRLGDIEANLKELLRRP